MVAAAPDRLLTFRAGGRSHALPADAVREVVRLPRLTPIPHAPKGLSGLGNVRGIAVPILSVAVLRDLAQGPEKSVLLLEREPPVGLLVDEVTAIEPARRGLKRLDVEALLALAYRQVPKASSAGLAQRSAARAIDRSIEPRSEIQLIAFGVAGQTFALPLDQVEEVIALPADIIPLPRADAAVLGTTLHRGAILPLLRLDHLLGFARDALMSKARIVVATIRGRRVGLVVDAMHQVLRLPEQSVDPVPAVIARRASEARIQAIGQLPGGQALVSILASDHLLDDTLMAQLEERNSDQEAETMAVEQHETFLLFRLGEQSFGLPATAVEAVVRVPESLIRIPKAPALIEGVMSVRGHAVPVIDQRRRFGADATAIAGKRAILLSLGALRACFVVDSVGDVRVIGSGAISTAPEIGAGPQLFDRVATLDGGDRMVLLIEPEQLLDGAERDLLASLAARADAAPA